MGYKPLNNPEKFVGVNYQKTDVAARFRAEIRRLKAVAEAAACAKIEQAEAAAKLAADLMEQAAADEAERLRKVAPMRKAK